MTIYITDKDTVRTISLRCWDNKTNNGWSPDCFDDLATDLPIAYPVGDYDTDAACAMTDAEYQETVDWWEAEIAKYNNREHSGWFVENLSDDEIDAVYADDIEYGLFTT